MKKKLIAVAIATAFAAPAFADNSNVEVYGKVFLDMESVKTSATTGTNPTSLNRVASNASRLGVKGKEDLGDGLNAIWQYELEMDAAGNSATGGLGKSRNSNLGLAGGFGTAFLGIWDTPYKVAHNKIELFDNTTFGSATNVIGRSYAGKDVNFNDRHGSSFQYWSPKMEGFQVKLAYSPDTGKVTPAGTTSTIKQDMLSLSADYENEMFYAAYAYANYNDTNIANAAAATNKVNGNRLVGAVMLGDGTIGLTYERLNSTSATAAANGAQTNWELVGKYKFGASNLGLSYAKAGNLGANAATGAKQLSLRYGYSFSKRTELYGMYTALTNDTGASFNFNAGTPVTSSAGAKLTGFGVGMIHSF